ncbi:Mechanosensitive ion channel [Acididesulfobacillus acetoxydans]|uniref:Mechanosensitive ion channel n=1 Tax=Acididesulfobacillus acetoxydans TaxID=1561005 RepID=A0A8S0VVM3_9FIRM|nr:mechanosensitive ion channel family protein [Acididesulfobacillus acetoxydans]CAA7599793.1 Mechanosensitive ion channel [Acididesulfobacillus acetoxydans]CEJ07359.1 Small-conductance mechanosensitive channel [Acididesulfobacillus acetoxydans]
MAEMTGEEKFLGWTQWLGFDWRQVAAASIDGLIYIAEVLLAARVLYVLIVYFLRRVLVQRKRKVLLDERKANTLFPLLRSIVFYVITFSVLVNILQWVFHFNTGTLLASAGVLGVALGFGSQSLVKDIIGGFFILFEDQFAVGEYITTGTFSGVVEEIGLRTTRLRDWGGELHILPNGSISGVTNFNRGRMRALVDIHVPYDQDLDHALEVMDSVCTEVGREYSANIVEAPSVQGVIQFGERNAVLRAVAYTKANAQWELERELRRRIHRAFLREGVRVPVPQDFSASGDPQSGP